MSLDNYKKTALVAPCTRSALALAATWVCAAGWAQTVPTPSGAASAPQSDTAQADAPSAADTARLQSVVVTATRGSKAIDKIPGAVTVVTRQDLDDQLRVAEDLSAVLAAQVPGYAPSTQKLTSAGESMRGRTALILFDGIPQSNPLRAGAREGYFADPLLIERIEVVSGPSAVQGLGATGGIINYISRKPGEEGTKHTLDAKFSTQGRSDDATYKLGYMLEHRKGDLDALVYLGGTQRGVGVDGSGDRLGLETTQGDLQDSTAHDVFTKLGWQFTPTQRLQATYNKFQVAGDGDWTRVAGDRAAGIPTSAQKGGVVLGRPPRNEVRSAALEWTHSDLAGGAASVQVYKQDFEALYGAGTFANFQDPNIAPSGTLVDQSDIVADKKGLRASWVRPDLALSGLEFTGGLDWLSDISKQRLALTDRDWVPPLQFQSVAPFVQLEYELGAFTLRGGLRHEHAELDVDTYTTLAAYGSHEVQGGKRSFDQLVKNLGLVWRFAPGWSGFVSYNEGFGLPDVGLVLRAVNVPDRSVADLAALEPILTDNKEVGLTWQHRLGSFTASVYESSSDLSGQVRIDASTGIGSVVRVPVRVRGFEFAGELRPAAGWTISASYARTRGVTAAAEGQPLDVALSSRYQGPDKLVLAARWAFAPGMAARMQASHYASRHVNVDRTAGTANLEEHFDGYTVADALLTWATRHGNWGLGIENLFDRQYIGYYAQARPSGTNDDYFAGRGRTYTASWRRSF
jgi:iron complex outermembrane receptor protein